MLNSEFFCDYWVVLKDLNDFKLFDVDYIFWIYVIGVEDEFVEEG